MHHLKRGEALLEIGSLQEAMSLEVGIFQGNGSRTGELLNAVRGTPLGANSIINDEKGIDCKDGYHSNAMASPLIGACASYECIQAYAPCLQSLGSSIGDKLAAYSSKAGSGELCYTITAQRAASTAHGYGVR